MFKQPDAIVVPVTTSENVEHNMVQSAAQLVSQYLELAFPSNTFRLYEEQDTSWERGSLFWVKKTPMQTQIQRIQEW